MWLVITWECSPLAVEGIGRELPRLKPSLGFSSPRQSRRSLDSSLIPSLGKPIWNCLAYCLQLCNHKTGRTPRSWKATNAMLKQCLQCTEERCLALGITGKAYWGFKYWCLEKGSPKTWHNTIIWPLGKGERRSACINTPEPLDLDVNTDELYA